VAESTQRTSEATAKKDGLIDTETHTAKGETKDAKIESMGDTNMAMRIVRARRSGGEIELATRATGMTSKTLRMDMEETMDTTRVTTEGTSSGGRTGSMASRAGTRVLRPSKAAQLYDRFL
jgi:hypothetical protein